MQVIFSWHSNYFLIFLRHILCALGDINFLELYGMDCSGEITDCPMNTWTWANYSDKRLSPSKMPHFFITEIWSLEECMAPSFWSKGSKIFKTLAPWTEWVRELRIVESFNYKPEMYSALSVFAFLFLWALRPCCLSNISTSPLPSSSQDISRFFFFSLATFFYLP